jgi:type IV pilus assembly protein PilA
LGSLRSGQVRVLTCHRNTFTIGETSTMRASVRNYIDAAKRRKEETGESGFSLIELIIVVVILGILVAIAIPIFGNIQAAAQENAVKAAAADVAVAVSAALADNDDATTPATAAASYEADADITVEVGSPTTIDEVCVTASGYDEAFTTSSGPGCVAEEE